jgi:hypothetical protein
LFDEVLEDSPQKFSRRNIRRVRRPVHDDVNGIFEPIR